MSSDHYCRAVVTNVESVLEKRGLRLPLKFVTPLSCGYFPEMDVTGGLKVDGVQWYQELIGTLRLTVEIGRIDILLEVSLLSTHLEIPLEVHLEQVLQIFGYLKIHKKMRLMFNCRYPKISSNLSKEYYWFGFYRYLKESILPNMPESRGHEVSISMFVDSDLEGDKSTRRSQTGELIFINKSPIHWYSKRQETF